MNIELKTDMVQVWYNGIMMRLVTKKEALEMVKSGLWRVFTSQSITSIRQ